MLSKISKQIHSVSTGWVTLSMLVVFILFTALVLPGQASSAKESTRADRSPDMSLFYSADDLYDMAGEYGEKGRAAYIQARFTFDIVWPLVYVAFLATALSWVFRRAFKPDSIWQFANLAPVFGTLLDYLENLATSLIMGRYPARTMIVDSLAPLFTLAKWLFVGGSFVLLGLGLIVWIVRWLQEYAGRASAEK